MVVWGAKNFSFFTRAPPETFDSKTLRRGYPSSIYCYFTWGSVIYPERLQCRQPFGDTHGGALVTVGSMRHLGLMPISVRRGGRRSNARRPYCVMKNTSPFFVVPEIEPDPSPSTAEPLVMSGVTILIVHGP